MRFIFKFQILCLFLFMTCAFHGYTASAEETLEESVVYEEPTMQQFSRLYWALSRMDSDNIEHLDNFMLINECDIYRDYFNHEFEWKQVRESAKNYVLSNKRSFPLRFQFMQPLRLGEYDLKNQKFDIYDDYKIEATKRFEVRASDSRDIICGKIKDIEGYPRGLMLELSRPFELTEIGMSSDKANDYISEKLQKFRELSTSHQRKRKNVFMTRDAYLVMKVKIFSSGENDMVRTNEGEYIAHVLGVLEGVELYADRNKQNLLFEEDFRKTRRKSPLELQYIAEYQAMKAARKSGEAMTPDAKEEQAEKKVVQ